MTLSRKVIGVICISFTAFAISACTEQEADDYWASATQVEHHSDNDDSGGGHHQ